MKLLREPLLHFVILGLGIFGAAAWFEGKRPAEPSVARIEVHGGTIAWLTEGFQKQWHRLPDAQELRGLVEDHIREEVLYREAIALGLDRNDTIVRRRLAQKMEFLTQDIVMASRPDDAALRGYYEKNSARYARGGRVSFRHVYFSRERHGAALQDAARNGLAALGTGASPDTVGDPFLREFEFTAASEGDIASSMGAEFAASLAKLPLGAWSGPVESTYGLHLVRVSERMDAAAPPFEMVRDSVARDLADEGRRTVNRELVERLRQKYQISVDEAALTGAPGAPAKTAIR